MMQSPAMMKYPARRFLLFRTGLSLGETIGSLVSLPLPLSICIVLSPSDRAEPGRFRNVPVLDQRHALYALGLIPRPKTHFQL